MAPDLVEVEMLTSFGAADAADELHIGEKYKLPRPIAERLVEREFAKPVEATPTKRGRAAKAEPETATREGRETAARSARTRR